MNDGAIQIKCFNHESLFELLCTYIQVIFLYIQEPAFKLYIRSEGPYHKEVEVLIS